VRIVPLVGGGGAGEGGGVGAGAPFSLDFGPAAGGDFRLFQACPGEIRRDCPSFAVGRRGSGEGGEGADFAFVGETWRSQAEVEAFNAAYAARHAYRLGVRDCRDYTSSLVAFLTGVDLPPARVARFVEAQCPTPTAAPSQAPTAVAAAEARPEASVVEASGAAASPSPSPSPLAAAAATAGEGERMAGAVSWLRDAAAAMRRSLSVSSPLADANGGGGGGAAALLRRSRSRPRLGLLPSALLESTSTASAAM